MAIALLGPLAWEPPYAARAAQENGKKTKGGGGLKVATLVFHAMLRNFDFILKWGRMKASDNRPHSMGQGLIRYLNKSQIKL